MSMRTLILAVTGFAVSVAACSSYGTSVVEVNKTPARVASVSVTVPSSLSAGQKARGVAITKDANGALLTDRPIAWFTSSGSIASVTDSGVISAVAPGTAVVSAVSEGVSGQATMAVVPPPPTPIATVLVAVTPSAVVVGQTAIATATLEDSSGNPLSGRVVTWESSNTNVATVDASGTVNSKAPGNAMIKATSEGKTNASAFSVSAPAPVPVASVSVSPATSSLQVGGSVQLSAVTRDANGSVLTGRVISWTSGTPSIATVSSSGLVIAVAAGSASITAASEGQIASAAITVAAPAPAPVASVSVSPAASSLQIGATVQLAAVTRDANSNTLTGRVVAWSSSNANIASVNSNSGLVTAVGAGSATITATSETKTGAAAITVTAPAVPVATVSVSPASSTLLVGATVQLSATTRDASSNVLTGRVVTWSSANANIASVNAASGLVTAVGAGSATITATSETKTGTAVITVSVPAPAPVATVSVSPASSSIPVGASVQLSATTRDASNNVLTGRVIAWSSGNAGIASVNSTSGLVTAVGVGSATITATSEGKSGSASITVTTPPPPGSSNEPSGMTLIDERPFNSLAEHAAPYSPAWDTDTNLTIVQDATAPISPSNVIRVTFPAGFHSGTAPGHAGVAFTGYKTLYVRFAVKLSLNWQGEDSGFCKYFYAWINGSGDFFFASNGVGNAPLEPYSMLQSLVTFPSGNGNWGPNLVPSARIIRGQWQTYEFVLVANSAGTADGSVDTFLDGVHITHVGGIQWTSGGGTWDTFEFRPIWGGTGSTLVQATQTMDMDNVYISGKN
jgi:uncharacterized protein YjdB